MSLWIPAHAFVKWELFTECVWEGGGAEGQIRGQKDEGHTPVIEGSAHTFFGEGAIYWNVCGSGRAEGECNLTSCLSRLTVV